MRTKMLLIAGLGYRELFRLRLSAEVAPRSRFNDETLPCLCQIQSVPAKQAMEKIPNAMPMRGEPPHAVSASTREEAVGGHWKLCGLPTLPA